MIESHSLLKYALFAGLLDEQTESILPLMQHEDYGPNEVIIEEGKPNDKIYFILEGQVSVLKGDKELARLNEGITFGEMEVLDVMPAIASIKSLTPVKTLSISNKTLRKIHKMDIQIFSHIIMNLARDISRRLRKMDEKFASSPVFI